MAPPRPRTPSGGDGGDGPSRPRGPGRAGPVRSVSHLQDLTAEAAALGRPGQSGTVPAPGGGTRSAKKIAKAIDDIDAPKPRKVSPPRARRPRSNPDAPVPSGYRPVRYGYTPESRIAQQGRLTDSNRGNVYGGMSIEYNGTTYAAHGRSSGSAHAEGDMLDRMRQQIAQREGVRPDQVDLRQGSNARAFVEFSPCDTRPRYCQDLLRDSLPDGTDVTYSWPWQPRSERDASRETLGNAVEALFRRGTPGPI